MPGLWEGPSVYEPQRNVLHEQGFKIFVTSLRSTGTKGPGNLTMRNDIKNIHTDLGKVVEAAAADAVIAIMHSAGCFVGSSALEELTVTAREQAGKSGGVIRNIFIAAGIAPEGYDRFGVNDI